ncbi:MAG TPA: PmoA family protein [Phycisphaerae bacterium]|nr:PmoA family protein [Phycisphaerae bacterium]HRY70038.1 PmoA family protein [Phycisphaerae bacterium]HSA27314.1 PmoA family protein [Phycisphaerae bacterium]
MKDILKHLIVPVLLVGSVANCGASSPPVVSFQEQSGRIDILADGKPVATYRYADPQIPRPYFAHVRTIGGIQVTRNHPPVADVDATDHDELHPGIWMAFGDLGGSDFWRNKARVVHDGFEQKPAGGRGRGSFAVRNRYLTAGDNGGTLCRETVRYGVVVRPCGYLLLWDSTFTSDKEFWFGDQEEMGLGLRVATLITVKSGGIMLDAKGRRNEAQIWGQPADWCDYSGVIDGHRVGLTVMCDPANFQPSRYHARDYGFVAANPFGRKCFKAGEESKVVVKPGESLRLRYGVLVHESPESNTLDPASEFKLFCTLLERIR